MNAYAPDAQDLIEAQILGLRELARKLEARNDELRAEVTYLARENASLWSSLHERDNQIRELQDMATAHLGGTR